MEPDSFLSDLKVLLQLAAATLTILVLTLPLFSRSRNWISRRVAGIFTLEVQKELRKTNRALNRINRTVRANHVEGMDLIKDLTVKLEEHEMNTSIHPYSQGEN